MTKVTKTIERSEMHQVEVSTVAFYEGRAPRSIALKDCSWPMASPPVTGICGIYGSVSKREAFMAARAHADSERINFTIIDFIVELGNSTQGGVMNPQKLSEFDFLNLQRISKPLVAQVGDWLQTDPDVVKRHGEQFQTMRPEQVMEQAPALIDVLAAVSACRHIRLFAFSSMTGVGKQPLNVGFVPFLHWSSIREATCRLDPTVHVTLDSPVAPAERASDARSKETGPRPRRR